MDAIGDGKEGQQAARKETNSRAKVGDSEKGCRRTMGQNETQTEIIKQQEGKGSIAMNMRDTIQQWINEKDLPDLLRTISELCSERYERESKVIFQKYYADFQRRVWANVSSAEQKDRDVNSAFMCVNLRYQADAFEKRIQQAGMSIEELGELNRKEEIERLECELERKRKTVIRG